MPLQERLEKQGGSLTLDGGLATELSRAGHDLDHPLWSARLLLRDPASIATVHRDFATAGADLVATATYQATFEGLAREGLDRAEIIELFRSAVALAIEATRNVASPPLVAASIGPYGAFLADGSEYRGDYGLSEGDLAKFHRDRLAVLSETEADLIAFETFPSAPEIRAAARLLHEEHPGREAWISCSCRNERELADGTPIEEVAASIEEIPEIVALGVNCVDPNHAAELIHRLREAAPSRAVIAYPNAGQGWDQQASRWRGIDTPEQFADRSLAWRAAGATIVGGCCETTPAHVEALARRSRGNDSPEEPCEADRRNDPLRS